MKKREIDKIFKGYGRFTVTCLVTGRKVYCEPIIPNENYRADWGDLDPATKKITGEYNGKSRGAVTESESLITEENGFTNITIVKGSPSTEIERRLKEFRQ